MVDTERHARVWRGLALVLLACFGVACSSAPKTTPELSRLRGKRVALVEVSGEDTAKRIAEVALINQLIKSGDFEIIGKRELEQARQGTAIDPMDWRQLARAAGADYALRIDVQRFDAPVREGFSTEKVYDSQIAEERGKANGEIERVYRVRRLDGSVQFALAFTDLVTGDTRTATAQAERQVLAEARSEAAHLPPRLRFLEELSNQAFAEFFKRYR